MTGPPPAFLDLVSTSPLAPVYRRGMTAVAVMAFLSFFACVGLAAYLIHRIIVRRRKGIRQNQLAILILNLMFASIQQCAGYLIVAHWLRIDKIDGASPACWAQGWFLAVGNWRRRFSRSQSGYTLSCSSRLACSRAGSGLAQPSSSSGQSSTRSPSPVSSPVPTTGTSRKVLW
jgi:hypothetical protein